MKTNQEKLNQMIEEQEKYYNVYPAYKFGETPKTRFGVKIFTKKEAVTVAKCQALVSAITDRFGGIKPRSLEINMTQWDYRGMDAKYIDDDEYGPQMLGHEKKAIYVVKTNCLQIWEDGLPIYENNNGVICRDRDALADCLC